MRREIIGQSDRMKEVYRMIDVAARTDVPVLIQGESGTGKELVAQSIHFKSQRRDGPFIPLSCAALSPSLLESELFGHERGAFTGAYRRKQGKIELADGGTLFLDDVDDIPLDLQVKLVRVLQEFQFERVGGTEPIGVDVRLIAATKRELAEMAGRGNFRDDLYYRLKVLSIRLPPLRERKEDIPLLVEHFLRLYASCSMSIAPEVLETLMDYDWPGNIRELENTIQRMIALCEGDTLGIVHIPRTIRYGRVMKLMPTDVESIPFERLMRETERQLILMALERAGWNKSRAAEILNIKRGTLLSKMKRLNIPMHPPES
jgi:DNA-binding NtrC family response regulator